MEVIKKVRIGLVEWLKHGTLNSKPSTAKKRKKKKSELLLNDVCKGYLFQ
jgi:hypothetical protein